ncbi:MAG: thiamine pyrophosphate-binding protein [Bacteroidota bacterium]|jgi:acetolactate synthase-1/2/3 large subunit|nr:thiamine pyrophosphate-binding protein [Bacteroidota bacterium]
MMIEDYLALQLKKAGVKRFFGIPGGPSIPWMEAFRKAGIEFVLATHESSAAMMADVTARLTGVTGVCHATFGPGAVNLASGVGGALLDRSPMLALTTEMPDAWLGRTSQMNIDHQALFSPLTKATYRLNTGNAREVIKRSLQLASEEYPGPVHIGLPSDLAGNKVGPVKHVPGSKVKAASEEGNESRAGVLIASAHRPLFAAGLTAIRSGAGRKLLSFLEEHGVPVVVTPMAKGIIPYDHSCYAGVLFHAMSNRLEDLVKSADLVIGLGYDPVEYNYESWLPDVPLVHFDTRSSALGIKGAIECVMAPEEWFRVLSPLSGSEEMVSLAAVARKEIRDGLYREDRGFNPVTALTVLREMLPAESTVTADVGSHLHLLGQLWDVQRGRLIMTNGWSSMGFGLPAAVAVALNSSAAPVVCVTGDGGLLMNAGEMITARRLGLKIIVVVFSDGELNLIKVKQSWKKVDPYGIQVCSGPLFGADTFLGIDVMRVTDAAGMRSALRTALQSGASVIIEAAVDPSCYNDLIVKN